MKSMKKVIVALVVALSVMMGMSMLSFAAGSVTRTSISTGKATAKTVGYTGKNQKPKITVKNADGKTLKEGRDYKVTYGTYKNRVFTPLRLQVSALTKAPSKLPTPSRKLQKLL